MVVAPAMLPPRKELWVRPGLGTSGAPPRAARRVPSEGASFVASGEIREVSFRLQDLSVKVMQTLWDGRDVSQSGPRSLRSAWSWICPSAWSNMRLEQEESFPR